MYHGWKIIVYSVTGYPYLHFAELLNIYKYMYLNWGSSDVHSKA